MQLCEEVADGLSGRGYKLAVLTSNTSEGDAEKPYQVDRLLNIDPDWNSSCSAAIQFFLGRRQREHRAVANLQRLVKEFKPDRLFIWHAIGLPRVLLKTAEDHEKVPVVYYLAGYLPELPDEYIAYWRAKPSRLLAKMLKGPLSKLALQILRYEVQEYNHTHLNSHSD